MKIIRFKDTEPEERHGYLRRALLRHEFRKPVKDMLLYGAAIPQGRTAKAHKHDMIEELFVFLSSGQAKINGKVEEFEQGDIAVMEPGDVHEFHAKDGNMNLLGLKLPGTDDDRVDA